MLQRDTYTDKEIIQNIKNGGADFERISEHLFHQFYGYIHKISQKMNMERTEAEDAYSDALVKLIRQIKNDRFLGESKLSTYFYSIYYNTCVDVLRKKATNLAYTDLNEQAYSKKERDLLQLIEVDEAVAGLVSKMEGIGGPCKKILLDWAYWGYSMQEIAQRSGLSNEASARSMKYKCLKKLKEILSPFKPKV